jgi:sporulation related protein
VTTGIRGTDVWGKSTPEGEIVCLIQGQVEVTPPGERPFTLDQPFTFYALEGNVSRPVANVTVDRFKEMAAETEEEPGRGVATRSGKWKITVGSAKTSGEAFGIYNEMRKAGFPAEIVPGKAGEARIYTVRIPNFESEKDAKSAVESLKAQAGAAKHEYRVGM